MPDLPPEYLEERFKMIVSLEKTMKHQVKDQFNSSHGQYYIDTIKTYGDIYEFGVCDGHSLEVILKQLTACNIQFRKVFGFDSFEGLPPEAPGVPKNPGWFPGNFNAQTRLNRTKEACKQFVLNRTDNIPQLIDGWFCETLTAENVKKYDMQKASYINIDVDLYKSTCEVLSFIFDNDLWQSGTIIRYDDWELGKGYGEERGHNEMMKKYDMECIHHYHYNPNTRLVEIVGQK